MTQQETLQKYLNAFPHHHESMERWPIQGPMRVRLSIASTLPPAHVSSSILGIVFNEKLQVLFLWPDKRSGSLAHMLIGGRPEPGETPEQAVTREVAEETGWRIDPIRMIGFRHFFQTEPRSENTDRPYPDFIQPIYAARAIDLDARRVIPADRIAARFLDFSEAQEATEPGQRPLLLAARNVVELTARHRPGKEHA